MFQRSICAWQFLDCFRARWLTAHHTDLSTITCRLLLDVSIVVSKLSDTSPRTNRWPLWKFVQSSNCWFSNFGQYVQRDKSSFIVPHIIVNRYYSRIYRIENKVIYSLTHSRTCCMIFSLCLYILCTMRRQPLRVCVYYFLYVRWHNWSYHL